MRYAGGGGAKSVPMLCKMMEMSEAAAAVSELDLSGNGCGDAGGIALADLLKVFCSILLSSVCFSLLSSVFPALRLLIN